jgi:NADP-dependent 3-hydroxy acid dehydrogenase YdfG
MWAISEGLRQENPDIRVTTISPGVVVTELGDDISDQSAKQLHSPLTPSRGPSPTLSSSRMMSTSMR